MSNQVPSTIPQMLAAAVERRGDQPALGTIARGELSWLTWQELQLAVQERAALLEEQGVSVGDRVVQEGPNSAEWIVNDLALHQLQAVHVPLHTSLTDAERQHQIEHSGARLVLGPNQRFTPLGPTERGPQELPSGLATLLYTSGTTGAPRGVMLTQENIVSNVIAACEVHKNNNNELRLLILPLSHIYARTCDLYCWLYRGSRLAVAESRETFVRDCQIVRPTALNAVPYLYQKLVDAVSAQREQGEGATLRKILGGAIRQCFSGGAAIAPSLVQRYEEEQIPLLPGYGLTETAPIVALSTTSDHASGTVGRPLPNIEVQLAEDGEIVVRGPSVMPGYWRDEAATAEVLRNGWFHTGDLGEWTDQGHLVIVGRKKELLALSTGKKVAPSAIEAILTASPLIEQAMIVGDGQSHIAALIVPNPVRLRWEIRQRRLWVWSKRRAVTHPKIVELYRQEIGERLAHLAASHQVRDFVILTRGFTIETGELTTKLSLRRSVIERNFAREIASLYSSRGNGKAALQDPPDSTIL